LWFSGLTIGGAGKGLRSAAYNDSWGSNTEKVSRRWCSCGTGCSFFRSFLLSVSFCECRAGTLFFDRCFCGVLFFFSAAIAFFSVLALAISTSVCRRARAKHRHSHEARPKGEGESFLPRASALDARACRGGPAGGGTKTDDVQESSEECREELFAAPSAIVALGRCSFRCCRKCF